MKDGFTRKKVESLTLGEKLKKLRGDFRMSLSEISKVTKIQVKYLEYLENGEYTKLPADVYVRGFLRSYARYLNIDEQAFIKLYERERHIQVNLSQETEKPTFNMKQLGISSVVITPRTVVVGMIFLLVAGAFVYLFREFQSFAGVPRLVITSPTNGSTIDGSTVIVSGKTDKGARVSINNQSVFVGVDGDFSDTITLQAGLNTMTIISVNRFDKEKVETISVEANYTPETDTKEAETVGPIDAPFQMTVRVGDASTKVTVEADGVIVFSGVMKVGDIQTIDAKDTVKILSEDGKRTFVKQGTGEEAPIGEEKEIGQGITYTASGKQE